MEETQTPVEPKHQCGVCTSLFDTEQEYLDHTCEKTGATPKDPEHLISSTTPNFEQVQQTALDRGAQAETAQEEEKTQE